MKEEHSKSYKKNFIHIEILDKYCISWAAVSSAYEIDINQVYICFRLDEITIITNRIMQNRIMNNQNILALQGVSWILQYHTTSITTKTWLRSWPWCFQFYVWWSWAIGWWSNHWSWFKVRINSRIKWLNRTLQLGSKILLTLYHIVYMI